MPRKAKTSSEEEIVQIKEQIKDPRLIIEGDPAIHLTIVSLARGKPFATTRFPGYSGYITRMCSAYGQENTKWFLDLLTAYFEDAYKHVPHIPTSDRARQACGQIEKLINTYGVKAVGGCLLAQIIPW